jgi:hypothetical protein
MVDHEAYLKALKRSHDEGIRITGECALDGDRSWQVQNPCHDGHYTVRLAAEAHVLTCSCPARAYCKHRAFVHKTLEDERAAQAAVERP